MESLDETPDAGGRVSPAMLRDWREVPSEALERKEVRGMLQEAITSLSPIYREVLLLRDVEELSIEETATALTISVASVKVRLHRAPYAAESTRTTAQEYKSKKEVVSMVIECKHVWDYISGYLDGSLSPETKDLVQRHLEHCEICSAILDSTRNILVLTADDRVFELPVGYSERLHARLAKEIARRPSGLDDDSAD